MTQTITGLFDSRADADRAIEALVQRLGVDRRRVQAHAAEPGATAAAGDDRGFWASLKDMFIPDGDRSAYSEGIRRGGVMVTATVEDAQVEAAADAFEEAGAVDLDEREATWRTEGWTGGVGDAATAASAATGVGGAAAGLAGAAGVGAMGAGMLGGVGAAGGAGATAAGVAGTAAGAAGALAAGEALARGGPSLADRAGSALGRAGDAVGNAVDRVTGGEKVAAPVATRAPAEEQGLVATRAVADRTPARPALPEAAGQTLRDNSEERIPIVEESLRVGKREVDRGRVRVRSYVVETPVEEQVTLRQETVGIERRAVDQALTGDAADALFRERTIEAVETSEEAVIAKDVRVKEELVVRKAVDERVQTVRDTVRHTEVEVQDDRTPAAGAPRDPARRT